MEYAIEIEKLIFHWDKNAKPTLDIAELKLAKGQKLFIEGPSGAGKSTLLSLLAGIEPMQQGQLKILGQSLTSLSSRGRDKFRAENIGYVFQQFNLLPYLSVLDNVRLADTFRTERASASQSVARAESLLAELAIPQQAWQRASSELSVGQQQRLAIARALFAKPAIIIADEPTSALDHKNAAAFMQLLLKQTESLGATLVYVSHDESLRLNFDQTIRLKSTGAGL